MAGGQKDQKDATSTPNALLKVDSIGEPSSAPGSVASTSVPTDGVGHGKDCKGKQAGREVDLEGWVKVEAQAASNIQKAAWKMEKQMKYEEGDEIDLENPPTPRAGLLTRCCSCIPRKSSAKRGKNIDGTKFDKVRRPFEISLSVTSIRNVLSENVDAFFSVRITAVDPHMHHNKIEGKLLPQYTGAKMFHAGETFVLDNPEQLYNRNFFSLSYADLHKHQLQVDMWRISKFSFNTYHGVGHKNLFDIANGDPNVNIFLRKAVCPKEEVKRKGKAKTGSVYDVGLFQINVQLEEVFDFSLRFENFCFEPNIQHTDYRDWMKSKKSLTFVVPRHANSDAQRNRRCATQSNEFVQALGDMSGFLWKNALEFVFSGTRTQLTTSCFLINVSSGSSRLGPHIGKALLGLTSILEMSVFKGTVKALSTIEKEFNIGKISGNVRFQLRSKGIGNFVDQLPLGCPMQPSSASLSHLKRTEKHLVISVQKCEGLPVADPEFGWSDPYLRVSWDNMMKRSWVSPNTTRPVFNINFYFPVRLFSTKLESVRYYRDTALQYELQSKGPVNITVWDDDPNSSELLGTFSLPLSEILCQTTKAKRTLKGAIKEDDGEHANEFVKPKKVQWFDEVEDVRVYDGGKNVGGTALKTRMSCATKPLIFFEAYFYPDDLPMTTNLDFQHADAEKADRWMSKEKTFRQENRQFSKKYKQAFPESIGALPVPYELGAKVDSARRFPCLAENQSLEMVPLPAFLVKIVTPEEYTRPQFLLHWVSCIPFYTDSKQSRSGVMEKWNDPQMMLFARQGSPQDHAILLCSILLGAKKDAYVVKGMVWQKEQELFEAKRGSKMSKENEDRWKLVEHAWVMTREMNDYICFWEPCTREIFHLPQRYKTSRAKKNRRDAEDAAHEKALAVLEEEDDVAKEDDTSKDEDERFDTMVADVQLGAEDIEGIPIIGALPSVGRSAKGKAKLAKKGESQAEKAKAALLKQREKLSIAPQRSLLDPEETLVDWLPYDSIEIVFNDKNVWANHQNHHPSCITYDIDEIGWAKLLKDDAEAQECKIDYIQQDVVIDAAASPSAIANLESKTITEMQENMRLTRRNRGLDTGFDLSKSMRDYIDIFLTIHEQIRILDKDMCPLWRVVESNWTEPMKYTFKLLNEKRPFNKWGTAFQFDAKHKQTQEIGWMRLFTMVETFLGMKSQFPLRRGKDFDGFPVHFSTADRDHMRKYLVELSEYNKILGDKQENTAFVVHCKMFGFLNQITSVWLYFGMHQPSSKLLVA